MHSRQIFHLAEIPAAGDPGRALPHALRVDMERLFNAGFETVRVHFDQRLLRLGALAATCGERVNIPPGLYEPDTPEFRRLPAHELAHVLQQREGRVSVPPGGGPWLVEEPALEAEADTMAWVQAITDLTEISPASNMG